MPGGVFADWTKGLAGVLRRAARALDPEIVEGAPQGSAMEALRRRFPGAPEVWLEHLAATAPHLAAAPMAGGAARTSAESSKADPRQPTASARKAGSREPGAPIGAQTPATRADLRLDEPMAHRVAAPLRLSAPPAIAARAALRLVEQGPRTPASAPYAGGSYRRDPPTFAPLGEADETRPKGGWVWTQHERPPAPEVPRAWIGDAGSSADRPPARRATTLADPEVAPPFPPLPGPHGEAPPPREGDPWPALPPSEVDSPRAAPAAADLGRLHAEQDVNAWSA